MHNVAGYRPPITIPGLSQQSGRGGFNSSPTVVRKWTFHTWSTRYTQINPLLTPTLLDWTQFRKEKQYPLGRLEERQRRSFSPKPRGLSMWILADLRPPCSRPLRYQIRSCLKKEKEGWDGDSRYTKSTKPSAASRTASGWRPWYFRGVATG